MRLRRHRALLAALCAGYVSVGAGCAAEAGGATPLDRDGGGMAVGDAALADDSPTSIACDEGFSLDGRGGCAMWSHLTTGAPTCFGVSMVHLPRTGRVLVLGSCWHEGDGYPPAPLYGFVFDPADGTWRVLPDAPLASTGRTAIALSDGRVLVAGGAITGPDARATASAVLFDPETETFAPTGAMTSARWAATATLLDDGRVLVAGGVLDLPADGSYVPTASAELFDPVTQTWHAAAPLRTARWDHTATLLPNRRVVLVGGVDGFREIATNVEIYDPLRDAWHDGPSIESLSGNHTVTLLDDGSLLVLDSSTALRSFAALTGLAPVGRGLTMRQLHFAIPIDSGLVLVVGGVTSGGDEEPAVQLYDASTDTWAATNMPPQSGLWNRNGPSFAAMAGGVLLHADNVGFFTFTRPPLRAYY